MIVRAFVLLACLLCCSLSHAEETKEFVEIPLDQIWGLNIPGTNDIRLLEGAIDQFDHLSSEERRQKSLVSHISWLLGSNFRPNSGTRAGQGFVVQENGLAALKEANKILAKKSPRLELFRADSNLTLVFFSYSSPARIELEKVTRSKNEVTVQYRLLNTNRDPSTRYVSLSSASFALIPIGKFNSGPVAVRIELSHQEGHAERHLLNDQMAASSTVCDSFTFSITKKGK